MCGSRGETEGPTQNHKNVGVLAILVLIPLKSESYQTSFKFWAIIGTAFRWRAEDGPLIVVFG